MTATPPFLGIDFGTSTSTMAWYNPRSGQSEIIRNAEGEEKTPSVAYYGSGSVLVGTAAANMLDDENERSQVYVSIKRYLGKPMSMALPDLRLITPSDVASDVLRKLKRDAETGHFREPVDRVVLTCPASFTETERQTLTEAATRAGFRTIELLEEPVAAALAYARAGLNVKGHVLVYDLGGGTFDLAVLARDEDGFRTALPPTGLRNCGGDDFDRAIYDHCDELARGSLNRPISGDDRIDLQFLGLCRQRKEQLGSRDRCEISTFLPGGVRFQHTLERSTFERLISRLVQETVRLTRAAVEDALAHNNPVGTVVLIGGSSRVPLVRQLLIRDANLPAEPEHWQQQDLAVALGAAYQGHTRWGIDEKKKAESRGTSKAIVCPECASEASPKAIRCSRCGYPFPGLKKALCPDCGGGVSTHAANCPGCGCPVNEAGRENPAPRHHERESDMALVSCPECNSEVSTKATSCPHCGNPLAFTDAPIAPPSAALSLSVSAPPADDRHSRLREDLQRIQRQFAGTTVYLDSPASASGIWSQLLIDAEDLLTTVCGRERFQSFLDSAHSLKRLHTQAENTLPNAERRAMRRRERGRPARPGHVQHDELYENELDTLKRRISAIVYRV